MASTHPPCAIAYIIVVVVVVVLVVAVVNVR
jgi:hypothetical protein